VASYGRFAGPPTRAQLERFFFLRDDDRTRVAQRRQPHTQLGFAVQLGTVRFLGAFLADPLDVPHEVVAYVAGQLGMDPACFPSYAERAMTAYEHTWEIRRAYGYRDFAAAAGEPRAFLAARAWTSNEGPRALFDRATAWLIERKILLPGATTLAREIVAIRGTAAAHLWRALTGAVDTALRRRLERLLDVEAGARYSTLERLRTSPSRVSGPELVRALERVVEVRQLGAGAVDVSAVPAGRMAALARYGMAAKAPHLRQLTGPRRVATLLATVRQLEQVGIDDALDLLDVLLATKVLARATQAAKDSAQERLRTFSQFAAASTTLAAAVQILFDETAVDDARSVAAVWTEIERVVPRSEVAAALMAVVELAPPPDEDADAAWRAELVKRYATVRPFLLRLCHVIRFSAAEGGRSVLWAVQRLPEVLGRPKIPRAAFAADLVTGSWKRFVYGTPSTDSLSRPDDATRVAGDGDVLEGIDYRAYAVCVLEHLHRALRRRDVFAVGSDRWGDPRARLLEGAAWERTKPEILAALGLPAQPDRHLAELAELVDTAYRDVAARLPENAALELTDDGERLHLARLEADVEPPTLVELRDLVARMLPRVDLPELLLEVHGWTGYLDEFAHVSEAGARLEDLALSVAAVLVAEACNIGLRPVVKPDVLALTRDRLSHVDQNYVRAETLRAANARLIAAQAEILLAAAWGGGLVASADGLRFVVPVATVNAGPNPRYFGVRRGVRWLNAVNDQYAGLGALVVPGTIRDSLYILDLLLNLDGGTRPKTVVTDTASYSDMVFGLFQLLGYLFSPRIADLTDTRFWRINGAADYGPLDGLARAKVNLTRIREHWPDMLRVAGSLATGTVRAYDLLRMLSHDGRPSRLGQAFAAYGRLPKTLHLLAYIDVDDTYRRQLGAQLTIQESRHQLGRRIFHGQRGELRQHYREGQADQLSALGPVLNAVVFWNTFYMDRAVAQLRADSFPVRDEDISRLAPLGFHHVNFLGRYVFTPPEPGRVRPLRDPADDDEDE
jgi:TnpA family transposase